MPVLEHVNLPQVGILGARFMQNVEKLKELQKTLRAEMQFGGAPRRSATSLTAIPRSTTRATASCLSSSANSYPPFFGSKIT